jgi:hypothetical protein
MVRTMTAVLALASLVWLPAGAMAQQAPMSNECQQWLTKIDAEAGTRVDEAGWKARQSLEEIAKLCQEGKTVEAQKTATETMTMLGINP